jgi:hypothetical protein
VFKLKPIVALVLLFSLVFVIFTRFYKLDSLPPALFSDEVDAQYQASFFTTFGTDYFGNRLPIHFHSFSDWRTSLSIYSAAFIQKILPGLSSISSRYSSAIYGLLFIGVSLLLSRLLFSQISPILVASLILSPWLIHYSRTGFEVTGMLFCLVLGLYFWFKFLESRSTLYLTLAPVFLILSSYFYSTSKLYVVFIFFTFLLWAKDLLKLPLKSILLALFFTLVTALPLIKDTLAGHAGYRFSYINIFSAPQLSKTVDYARYQDIYTSHLNQVGVSPPLTSFIFHNRPLLIAQTFISNYFSSFSLDFLLLKGDANLRHGFGAYGYFYVLDIILILYGLFLALTQLKSNRTHLFFIMLLIFAPIPYALTRDSLGPHATRLIIMLIPTTYFIGLAASRLKPLFRYSLLPLYFLLFIPFWHYYTQDYPQISARTWHSGLKDTVEATRAHQSKTIYFSNAVEPFLPFFLYYWPYFPADKNINSHLSSVTLPGFDGQSLDSKYFFGSLNLTTFPYRPNSLLVIDTDSLKSFPDWSSKFKVVASVNRRYLSAPDFVLLSPL